MYYSVVVKIASRTRHRQNTCWHILHVLEVTPERTASTSLDAHRKCISYSSCIMKQNHTGRGAAVVGAAVVGAVVVEAAVVGAAVVGAAVVGEAVVGAFVVGAAVVGAPVVGAGVRSVVHVSRMRIRGA